MAEGGPAEIGGRDRRNRRDRATKADRRANNTARRRRQIDTNGPLSNNAKWEQRTGRSGRGATPRGPPERTGRTPTQTNRAGPDDQNRRTGHRRADQRRAAATGNDKTRNAAGKGAAWEGGRDKHKAAEGGHRTRRPRDRNRLEKQAKGKRDNKKAVNGDKTRGQREPYAHHRAAKRPTGTAPQPPQAKQRASANGVPRYFQGVKVNYDRHINIAEIRRVLELISVCRQIVWMSFEAIKSTVCRRSEDRKVFGQRFDRGFSMPSLCFV